MHSVYFDNAHLMAINPEEKHGKCSSIDDPQAICHSCLEGDTGIAVEAIQVSPVLREVDERSLC